MTHTKRNLVPSRQLDPGSYEVKDSGTGAQVGFVFVDEMGSSVLIEHWALDQSFKSPTTKDAMVVNELAEEEEFSSFSAFKAAMQQREQNGASYRYVEATCRYYDNLPD